MARYSPVTGFLIALALGLSACTQAKLDLPSEEVVSAYKPEEAASPEPTDIAITSVETAVLEPAPCVTPPPPPFQSESEGWLFKFQLCPTGQSCTTLEFSPISAEYLDRVVALRALLKEDGCLGEIDCAILANGTCSAEALKSGETIDKELKEVLNQVLKVGCGIELTPEEQAKLSWTLLKDKWMSLAMTEGTSCLQNLSGVMTQLVATVRNLFDEKQLFRQPDGTPYTAEKFYQCLKGSVIPKSAEPTKTDTELTPATEKPAITSK